MKNVLASIRAALPRMMPFKSETSRRILDALCANGTIEAVACPAYCCVDGWVEGMGAGFSCPKCLGLGWVKSSHPISCNQISKD